ncbi:MAG TPA: rRNA maturation RNase YbeY [Candidatus Acidoferrales bacterium]
MIVNRQRRVRIPVKDLNRFLASTQKRLRVPSGAVTVALVSDLEMKRWNRAFRGKNRPTDVLSFPQDEASRKKSTKSARRVGASTSAIDDKYLGDIAIAPAVAQKNARRFGRTFIAEMRILILHGILHLMGYDHETDQGQMDRREGLLRRELGLT